jgi:hypothetical protein
MFNGIRFSPYIFPETNFYEIQTVSKRRVEPDFGL